MLPKEARRFTPGGLAVSNLGEPYCGKVIHPAPSLRRFVRTYLVVGTSVSNRIKDDALKSVE